MNIYVLVEGRTGAKRIYKNWITFVNPNLKGVDSLNDVNENNFFILAGYGQPRFFSRIENAIEDVNNLESFDRLVIGVDTEGMDPYEKYLELRNKVDKTGCRVEVRYIIQHFCIESWFLGNKHMFRKKPQNSELVDFMKRFNVRNNDPEQLPEYPARSWNKAQFAFYYLRAGILDTYSNSKSYTKKNPGIVAFKSYFTPVKQRCLNEQHIKSFESFLSAFD